MEDRRSSTARLDDGKVEELVSGRDRGAGIRVVRGDTTGFAHTADLSEAGLRERRGRRRGRGAGRGRRDPRRRRSSGARPARHTRSLRAARDGRQGPQGRAARARRRTPPASVSDSIRQVTASYADARRRILVANSDGLLAEDDQVRTRFDGAAASRSATPACRPASRRPAARWASSSSTRSTPRRWRAPPPTGRSRMLDARPAPRGKLPVVLRARRGRRAVPRGVRPRPRGRPRRQGRVGVPRATWASSSRRRSSRWSTTAPTAASGARYAIDDEGAPAQRNVLIENGVLTDYMWDLVRARKEGRASSGNGRRETYQHLPMVRMTNTFLLEGDDDPDDIIRGAELRPLLRAARRRSGRTPPPATSCSAITEAYLIENGEITEPVRAAQLIGNGPEVLRAGRRGRQRLRHLDRHVRQGRPERAGLVGAADPARARADRRRHRR